MKKSTDQRSDDDVRRIVNAIDELKGNITPFQKQRDMILSQLDAHDEAIQEIDRKVAERIKRLEDRQARKYRRLCNDINKLEKEIDSNVDSLDSDLQSTKYSVVKNTTKITLTVSIVLIVLSLLGTFAWEHFSEKDSRSDNQKTPENTQSAIPRKEEAIKPIRLTEENNKLS